MPLETFLVVVYCHVCGSREAVIPGGNPRRRGFPPKTDLSLEAIARALKISKGVVAKYLRLAEAASVGWPLPEDCDDLALERLLYRQPEARSSSFIEPDYARVHQELKSLIVCSLVPCISACSRRFLHNL